MIKLYAFGRVHPAVHGLTRDLRVQWALEELGLPYQVQALDHTGGELSQEEFRHINLFQQLPVIDDDGFVLAESAAILFYLAEKAGALLPADAKGRAVVSRWCFAALTTVEPEIQRILLMAGGKKPDEATQALRETLATVARRHLADLEAWFGEHEYLAGAELTIADILMTTVIRYARRARLLEDLPRCEAYRQRCEARPAWARTVEQYEARLHAEPGAVQQAAEPR